MNPKYYSMIEFDSEEEVVCIVRKHPLGLLAIYLTGFFIAVASSLGALYLGELIIEEGYATIAGISTNTVAAAVSAFIGLLVIVASYLIGFIYQNNILVVTTDKVVQVIYRNLVDRKISQLSLGDLQDVTVDQRGLFARIFSYGTLVIETAGEQNNYNFSYAENPHECSSKLFGARENSIKKYGN